MPRLCMPLIYVSVNALKEERGAHAPPAGHRTTTIPCIDGWMWQVYEYVPAVVNVRAIDTWALVPGMSPGTPAWPAKKTLCGTEPKANVTASPVLTVSEVGVN